MRYKSQPVRLKPGTFEHVMHMRPDAPCNKLTQLGGSYINLPFRLNNLLDSLFSHLGQVVFQQAGK
jgi:hypothetical protein